MRHRKLQLAVALTIGLIGILVLAVPAMAHGRFHEAPPSGDCSPSQFATQHHGLLGPLRSSIANGDSDFKGIRKDIGLAPDEKGFTGDVNPGVHQGTVAEEEFLFIVLGMTIKCK